VQHHRTSARAQYEAGLTLAGFPDSAVLSSPTHAFARRHFELSNSLDPNSKLGWLSLIHLNCKAGISVDRAEVNELSRRLRESPFAPGDRNVLYGLKEMAIAGSICLTRPEIDGLFAASLANPSVSHGVQAMLNSWHADYLWLHERDISAARAALGRSLTLNPSNPSNRLKWAQLILISGEQHKARQLLLELRDESFSEGERKTLNELLTADNIAGH
ncbi:MAG: tetratricopeptide repeat protein, partial [Polaromonas sp.]